MGLLPLEFSDCLLDSPYYRENLRAHEKQLEQTSVSIKALIGGISDVLDSAKMLIKSKKALAEILDTCQFDCLGTTLTDDEILIAASLKQFATFLSAMEDEMNGILDQANEKFIAPLFNFRKEQVGSVKNTKKAFEKATSKLCQAQDKYVALSGKKEETLAEATETVRHEQKNLNSCSLEYVYLLHMVQERKKFEFVEAILNFTQSWVRYYQKGAEVARGQEGYMTDLKQRVKKTRDNFSATSEKYEGLKEKMLSSQQDPGVINKMYTRQGYLFVQAKKNLKLGSVWTKYFCQYQSKTKTLTMIPYSQLSGKISGGESVRVTSCVCHDDSSDKFRFSVTGEDLTDTGAGMMTHNIQALSEFERKNWVEALGGTWPAVNTLQRIRADSVEDNINSCAFTFLKDCLSELESRGLTDQGLYRVGGVVSKVKKLLNQALDPGPGEEVPDMSDPKQWESKTLASAVKQYFRDLSKPLMTYQLYSTFVEAAKKEDEATRLNEIYLVLQKLPRANREILKVLIRHLNKVSLKSDKNLMTSSNLGVVFGPNLLWPREETVASIMDTKFCNEVVGILIEHSDRFFPNSESSPEFLHNRRPSLESRSTAATGENASPVISTSSSNKCKRTQSFSSISQLSMASLPEIKEFHPEKARNETDSELCSKNMIGQFATSDRPRSKSHQHDGGAFLMQTSTTTSSSKEGSPAPLHLSKAATQDDLMASLEMMNFLAADLPSSSSPLKRSYTLNPKRMTRTPGRELKGRPPLPKLPSMGTLSLGSTLISPSSPVVSSSVSLSARSPTVAMPGTGAPVSPASSAHHPLNSRHNSTPNFKEHLSRPSDLPSKLITTVEGMCLSPGQTRRAYLDNNLLIREYGDKSPPKPVRKSLMKKSQEPRYQSSVTMTLDNDTDTGSYSSGSPRAVSEDRDYLHSGTLTTNVSVDSGVLISPSPPADTGITLLSPGVKRRNYNNNVYHQDSVSVLSYSLSEASDASGSKYDNVGPDNTKHDDDLSEEETDDILDNDQVDSKEITRVNTTTEVNTARVNKRVSGYENVLTLDQTDNIDSGLHSLQRILTNGQTTNV